jgi:hypothetical protein
MASTEELIAKHGEGTVRKAFWLQEHIFEEGIRGAGFSTTSKRKMEAIKRKTVKEEVEDEFKDSI